jgi:ATP-binding cassette subfamily A (ABC1) protein 3
MRNPVHCLDHLVNDLITWFRFRQEVIAAATDEDVVNEAERVEYSAKEELQVRVHKFSKEYRTGLRSTLAVSNTSFGLSFGECFALLGVNGAGKTTTFKSLTNEIKPTSGSVSIGGFDINKRFSQARRLIGFCPQENVLFEQLTVEEHLFFYALLKGIPSRVRRDLVESTITEMDLQE